MRLNFWGNLFNSLLKCWVRKMLKIYILLHLIFLGMFFYLATLRYYFDFVWEFSNFVTLILKTKESWDMENVCRNWW